MAKKKSGKGGVGVSIFFVLVLGFLLCVFLVKQSGWDPKGGKVKGAQGVREEMKASPGRRLEKLQPDVPSHDKIDRHDREELNNLIDKVGK